MFLKSDYVFAPISLFLWEVELEISFSTYFIRHCWLVDLTPFHLNKKIQKINRHLFGKNFEIFLQNSTFFRQILMIILKIDVTLY